MARQALTHIRWFPSMLFIRRYSSHYLLMIDLCKVKRLIDISSEGRLFMARQALTHTKVFLSMLYAVVLSKSNSPVYSQ